MSNRLIFRQTLNTDEPLFVVNRPGNRPSHEGAAPYLDRAIGLCREAGFTDILMRGDTDFSQTQLLDAWAGDGVRFVFGYDAKPNLVARAEGLEDGEFSELERRAKGVFELPGGRALRPDQPAPSCGRLHSCQHRGGVWTTNG